MEKYILHIKNCIAEVLIYLIFIMVEIVFLVAYGKEDPGLFRLVIPVTIPLFYYLVRCMVHRFWLFLLLHILPLGVIIIGYGDSVIQVIIFTLAALIQAALSLNIRVKTFTDPDRFDYGSVTLSPIEIMGMSIGLYLMSRADELLYPILFYILLYFIYLYLGHFLHYVDMNRRITGDIPEKSIFVTNFGFVGVFTVISALVMIGFADIGFLKAGLRVIIQWLGYIVRFLLSLIPFRMEESKPPEPPPVNEFVEAGSGSGTLFARILEILLIVFGMAAVLIFVAILVYMVIRLLRRTFGFRYDAKAPDGDDTEKDIVEKLEHRKSERKRTSFAGLFKTPEEKIRRIYWKVLQKRIKIKAEPEEKSLLRYGTARECLALLREDDGDGFLLVKIYEKARYGYKACSEEDVKEARRLARRLADV